MVKAVRPGGTVLDLQVIKPNPRIEVGDRLICELDAAPLLERADAATAAIGAEIQHGRLVEEAADDHDARTHFANGADLVADFTDKELARLPKHVVPELLAVTEPCVRRDRCRLRRLTSPGPAQSRPG
jgi:hypothetical protein